MLLPMDEAVTEPSSYTFGDVKFVWTKHMEAHDVWYATVRTLVDPDRSEKDDGILDSESLLLYLPAPRTVTGEDVLELHVHGGTATVRAVLEAIPRCRARGRIRYAEPGEFTKRAFVNNRLDLAQIESLSDTLAAETEQQRRAAVRGNSGALGRTYEDWRRQLLLARGEIEALIDFSEDQHFDEPQGELLENVVRLVRAMVESIQQHELGSQRSELLRNGIQIALLGPPNVGKSSLMNLIVGREASIVSGEAGTTRDIIEASLDIRGYLCSFADTAGFRSRDSAMTERASHDGVVGAVEEEGIRRARQKALEADVVIVVGSVEIGGRGPFIHYDKETVKLAGEAQACLVVVNKRDMVDEAQFRILLAQFGDVLRSLSPAVAASALLTISCRDGQGSATASGAKNSDGGGLQSLVDALVTSFSTLTDMPGHLQDLLGVTERQRQLLVKCRRHLGEFLMEAQPEEAAVEADTVLAAEYLRYAADCLARLTGTGEASEVEDVLGVVFEK
ncbi:hypothetical protein RJ55_05493 [Drechmeria coniospora]|nr:hypothetical protein RJ55_05493 [Drechmeria coniospora]